jgi:DNA polymerase elongation subunit (family B)
LKKKRYWGKKYENSTVNYKLESKGTDDVRRSSFAYTSNLLTKIRVDLIENASPEDAKITLYKELESFTQGHVPFELFILSKSLKNITDYKFPEKQIHVNVVSKMAARNPGSEPRPGDRVPFVIITTKNVKDNTYKKSEDPEYVRVTGLELDLIYYFEHYVQKSILSVFEAFDPDLESHLQKLIVQMQNKQRKQSTFDVPLDFKSAPPPRKRKFTQQNKSTNNPQKSNLSQFLVKKQ